jgi:predicted dehydrogenase
VADGLRVAVVGCGRMGRAHVEALLSLTEGASCRGATAAGGATGGTQIEVVACDPVGAARAWAAAQGVRAYEDLDKADADGSLDAVVVAVPTPAHVEAVSAALELGCAVLCEKPGGESPAALLDLGARAGARGLPLRLGYWHRFVPALRRVRDAVGDGSLGEVLALTSAQWDGVPPSPAFLARSGGELVDMGVHEIDFARWSLGCRLEPRGAAWRRDPEGHNAAVGVLQGERGTVVTVSAGRMLEGGYDGCWVELLGSRSSIFDRWLWGPEGEVVNRRAVVDQDREMLRLVAGGDAPHLATASEGAEVLALANALTAAATVAHEGAVER